MYSVDLFFVVMNRIEGNQVPQTFGWESSISWDIYTCRKREIDRVQTYTCVYTTCTSIYMYVYICSI